MSSVVRSALMSRGQWGLEILEEALHSLTARWRFCMSPESGIITLLSYGISCKVGGATVPDRDGRYWTSYQSVPLKCFDWYAISTVTETGSTRVPALFPTDEDVSVVWVCGYSDFIWNKDTKATRYWNCLQTYETLDNWFREVIHFVTSIWSISQMYNQFLKVFEKFRCFVAS